MSHSTLQCAQGIESLKVVLLEEGRDLILHDGYNPPLWARVFKRIFGEDPTGANDPRWDELLHAGYPLLNELKSALSQISIPNCT